MVDGPFDSHNLPFWDTRLGKYVVYARGVGNPDGTVRYSAKRGWFEPGREGGEPKGGHRPRVPRRGALDTPRRLRRLHKLVAA